MSSHVVSNTLIDIRVGKIIGFVPSSKIILEFHTQVPKYGVVTSHEEELGQCLENINGWGIDVFRIAEFSNNRPLTAVTFRVFQVT